MGYSFRLATRVFYMHHPTDRIAHTTAFVTPVMEHWLEREIERGTGDDTLYLQLYGIEHMVKNHLVRENPHCCYYKGYCQDSTHQGLCYTSRGALAGTRNRERHW